MYCTTVYWILYHNVHILPNTRANSKNSTIQYAIRHTIHIHRYMCLLSLVCVHHSSCMEFGSAHVTYYIT